MPTPTMPSPAIVFDTLFAYQRLLCVQCKHQARGREENDHGDRDGYSGGLGHAHYAAIIRDRFAGVEPYYCGVPKPRIRFASQS